MPGQIAPFLFFSVLVGSYFIAYLVPGWMKRRHVRRQNRLLDRCRAYFMAASNSINDGDYDTANDYLKRIRRLEWRWHLRSNGLYRLLLAVWAVIAGAFASVVVRWGLFAGFAIAEGTLTFSAWISNFTSMIEVFLLLGAFACLHALPGYLNDWTDPDIIDNCGDRLDRMINARGVAEAPEAEWSGDALDGLSAREILGVGYTFTKRQLNAARRRLARELHPDFLQNASGAVRRAHEEALKRVNAAYDELVAEIA